MDRFLPIRTAPVHFPPVQRCNRSTIVLVTVCTDKRRPLLAESGVVALLIDAWCRARAWQIGRYVVMPDHLRAFCAPTPDQGCSLAMWVKYWKALVSRAWPKPDDHPIRQQGFWDRQLRSCQHYGRRWEYVRNNPVRHGLVAAADAWPWQGELNAFRFHEPE